MSDPATFRERTLNSRYQPRQQLPPDFPEVLKEYAREVLRSQPADILSWSAAYFKQLALENETGESGGVGPVPVEAARPSGDQGSTDQIAQPLLSALSSLDSENTGRLYTRQVRRVLTLSYQLTPAQALYILASPLATPQIEEDDTVVYEPCVESWARLIQFFKEDNVDFAVRKDDPDTTVHNLSQRDVETSFLQLFRALDHTASNRLPFATFAQVLREAPFQLTDRDIRVACLECDRNNAEDDVDYECETKKLFENLVMAELFEAFDSQ